MASPATPTCTVTFQPLGKRARVADGTTLLEAARLAGVGLNGVCGGTGTCGTCRVHVVTGPVSPPTANETALRMEGLRLACETRLLGDAVVDVPPASMTAPQRAQVEGRERPVELAPGVRSYDLTLAPPTLDDLRADSHRLRHALQHVHGVQVQTLHPAVAGQLARMARAADWRIRAIVEGDEVLAVLPDAATPLGLAVDVGTTKLAGYLIDLASGETLAAAGAMNPQIAYGEDVMARITHAMADDVHPAELQRLLAAGIDHLCDELCAAADRDPSEVVEAVLVGNTCMHHLFLGLPVRSLGAAPYVPVLSEPCHLRAAESGLHLAPAARLHLLPVIAGFVGADHVAMILATGIHESTTVTLGLDIGTNTEIVLAAGGRLLSCSCASGPAFEGAHIRDGMRAAPGAIERVRLAAGAAGAPVLEYQTIEDAPPVGVCGSGVLDAVAQMLRAHILEPTGALRDGSHPRVRVTENGPEMVLARKGERDAPRDVAITRSDVNQLQLAKAAIRAGTQVLLERAGLAEDQIERVIVAGAFGTYLDVGSAIAIGMFPPVASARFQQVGNAAGMGARLCLLSEPHREAAQRVAAAVSYVELAGNPDFTDAYTSALMFPTAATED
ncbi:MAG: ASKHA domain-containing protein [Deinococcales bacterium]